MMYNKYEALFPLIPSASSSHKKHVHKPPDFPKKPVPPYSKYVTERYKVIKQENVWPPSCLPPLARADLHPVLQEDLIRVEAASGYRERRIQRMLSKGRRSLESIQAGDGAVPQGRGGVQAQAQGRDDSRRFDFQPKGYEPL